MDKVFPFQLILPMKRLFLTCLVFGFGSLTVYSQSNNFETENFQIDLYLTGVTKIKEFPDGSTYGIGVDYRYHNMIFGSQFLRTNKFIYAEQEATKYYNLDLIFGIHKSYWRFNGSLCTGVGLNYRQGNDSYFLESEREESYFALAIPIRAKFDYLIGEKFVVGLTAYTNINFKIILSGFILNIGYRF